MERRINRQIRHSAGSEQRADLKSTLSSPEGQASAVKGAIIAQRRIMFSAASRSDYLGGTSISTTFEF